MTASLAGWALGVAANVVLIVLIAWVVSIPFLRRKAAEVDYVLGAVQQDTAGMDDARHMQGCGPRCIRADDGPDDGPDDFDPVAEAEDILRGGEPA